MQIKLINNNNKGFEFSLDDGDELELSDDKSNFLSQFFLARHSIIFANFPEVRFLILSMSRKPVSLTPSLLVKLVVSETDTQVVKIQIVSESAVNLDKLTFQWQCTLMHPTLLCYYV